MDNVLNVTFVSVWDGGFEIETNAKYNTVFNTIFDIESTEGINTEGDEVEHLDEEFIRLPNGEKLSVYEINGQYKTGEPENQEVDVHTSSQDEEECLDDVWISMMDAIVIVHGEDGKSIMPLDAFILKGHKGVPCMTLREIREQILNKTKGNKSVTIDVWQELGLSGTIYRYGGYGDYWLKHGETRGYA